MSEKSLSVEGIVINSELGTGLANLSVEVWSLAEDAIEPLDKVRSDARGTFDLSVPIEPDLNLDGGIVRLEFRVLDRGELIIAEIREFGLDQESQPVQIFVPSMAPHRSRGDEAKESGPTRHEVYGRVRGPLVAGAKIRAILFSPSGDGSEQEIVGETPVDESGGYRLEHDLPQTSTAAGTRLQLQLLGPDDGLLVESDPVDISRHRLRVNLRMPGGGPSEYELLEERLYSEREVGPAVLDGLSSDALFELADEIDVAPERLALLQRVRALEVETGLPGPIFYALGRNGLSVEPEDLIDVPMSELRATIVAAVDDEIVDETIVQGIESRLAQLSERVLDRVLEADQPPLIAGLGEILAAADVPREVLRKVLERYQTRPGGVPEFWESLLEGNGEQEAVSEDVRSELETAVGLGGLLGADPALIRRMIELRREGRWRELEDLAEFEFDDWCELLESLDAPDTTQIAAAASAPVEDVPEWVEEGTDSHTDFEVFDTNIEGHVTEPVQSFDKRKFSAEALDDYERIDDTQAAYALDRFPNDESESDGDEFDEDELEAYGYDELDSATVGHDDFDEAEEDERDRVEIRAEGILDTLEEVFPSEFILRELLKAEVLSDGARRLLERTPKHDFLSESIRERTAQDSELFEGFESIEAEAVIEEVEVIERVSRVTHRAEEVLVLVGTGMNSAHAIAAQPRRHFIDVYGEALGGRAQASRVHAQAQQTAGASTLAMVRLLQALQQTPFVLGGSVATRNRAIKGMPDTRTLFGNIGLCECEHCRSVYSPAAYLVDLLRYLDVRDSERLKKLQEKLRKRRRPEREIRKLSQYRPLDVLLARRPDIADISLTCENTLTPLPYIDLVNELLEARITGRTAAHDTGSTPADVLKAVPQHVDRDAYERLRLAVYPATLPFHKPLAVARAYLGHLGLQRRDLLKSLARGEGRDDALLAEALEMSPEEFDIVSKPPSQLWRYFGFETEQVGGVPYTQALAHAPTFLRATGISFQELIDLVSTRFINPKDEIKLESPSPDCDPEKARITGLDENRLSAMVRILRLRKRLGFSLIDLDRALFALGAKDLDPPILQKLVEARDLSKKLDRPIVELLGLWSSLDTFGKDNQFERLLRTRAVAWRTQDADAFKLQENRLELAHTADSLDALAPALLAAFRMTSEELSLARALHARLAGGPPRLDLAGLSAVYRVAFLARALKLRIDQLDGLLGLVPADANPFRAADPAATRRFVEIVHEVQASAFAPEQLVYLYRPTASFRRDPGPAEAQVQAVLASIRQGLVDAFSETARPAELTGDFLRQKLGMWLDSALVDPAMEALDPRTRLTAEKRRQFFNRHLTRIFPDAEAAAQSLFTTSPPAVSVVTPAASKIPGEEEPPAAASVQSAASAAAAPTRDSAGEQKWRANIERVVDHLLPLLRARQMRGAVVKVLSDTLGMSSVSTGRLLDGVMHSRRSVGRPLIEDFFALLGTGLTGSYFTNRELQGELTVTRTDAKLEFSWAGAPPAPGIGGTGFSIRWAGRLLPRSKARHTFFVSTDGGVRLSMTVDGVDQLLLEETGGASGIAEYASKDIPLDPAKLYDFKIEYRNKGAAPSFAVQYGTSPDSKQPIPTANLFPVDGLSTFDPVSLSYRRLHKAALLLTGFGISEDQLEWLTGEPRYLDLDKLPMAPTESDQAIASFQRWRQLAALNALRKKLPTSTTDLFAFFKAGTLAEAITILVKATGWDKSVVETFVGDKGFAVDRASLALPIEPAQEPFLLRLERAVEIQRRAGVSPETLFAWAGGAPDADVATAIVQAVKARYDEKRWLEVAEGLNGPLRMERREALVTYLLPRLREQGVENRNQLFEYFLIDVEMNPCMLTSRIKQAISAIQTFYQRCLMNLESQVHPRLINEGDWKWLRNYRVWEANRKVFLYPENWIEPELRDDKSPDFKTLERTLLQQEINKENVESAFIDYLQCLDEVSRLDVRAVWFEPREPKSRGGRRHDGRIPPPGAEWEEGTYHIFARTYNAPHKWFYRRLERGRTWTPWEKMDVDIDGDHLVPVMFQNRMHLFWTIFREKSKPTPELKKDAAPFKLGKDWEIGLAYSVYDRGRWTRKQLSSANVVDNVVFQSATLSKKGIVVEGISGGGSAWLPASAYTLRADAQNGSSSLTIYLYRRAVDSLRAARTVLRAFEDALLSETDVELVARFELVGCNGELAPVTLGSRPHIVNLGPQYNPRHRRRAQPSRLPSPTQLPPFQVSRGGRLPVPPGYTVDGNGFSAAAGSSGALLTMPTSTGGMAVVLGRSRGSPRSIRILPIADPSRRPSAGLSPFFFQDPLRTYFVRPVVANLIGLGKVRIPPTAVPLVARGIVPHFGRRSGARTVRGGRGGHGRRRESLELAQSELALEAELGLERSEGGASEVDLNLEAIDDWEDAEDEAWHPDDASERRSPRQRTSPARKPQPSMPARKPQPPPPRPGGAVRTLGRARIQAPWEQRLRFTPFEHPQTCRLINALKSDGIEELLALSTTRPTAVVSQVQDHLRVNGKWLPLKQTKFELSYRPGLLADPRYPRLDIDFDFDNPYALYNWELFLHAPLQVATRLAKDGRHEEAQRWFHFIFDPTTDNSEPSPQRFWRFAPFHENTDYNGARELMALLSYKGTDSELKARKQKVEDQLNAWWEQPFSPHAIARLRISAYQKAVVMKYIDNLIEWGDKLFRRDTLETIQEATQLYILASNILGSRPERVPSMVETKPVTFREVRDKLDSFANWEVRFENSQVRRPFRINARPDTGATTSILGMATLYFCIPANPEMDKKWDTVADRLFKIRNCMNIAGVVRRLPLFEPPIDPRILVRAAAAGVDLGSVIASLNAPPPIHRFRFLVQRAIGLADQLRSFGAATLNALERRDAEQLATLRQSNETVLLESIRDMHKTKVKQVEEEIAWLALQREYVDVQIQHVLAQAQQPMNAQEKVKEQSQKEAQAIAVVAEGIDLASKVAYAIPEFQGGTAGGFSSPFVTVQMGGQMFGDIAAAVAESMFKVMNKFQTEAEMAGAQAEYQRRQVELMHQHDLLAKERERIQKQIGEIQLKLEISNAELKRHDTAVENARKIAEYLREKYTSEELYGWMLGQLSTAFFQAYKFAFDTAKLAERALQFERGDPSVSYIEFSYWDSLKKGLLSGERLLVDIRRMEAAYLEGDQRSLEVTRHVSLKEDAPTALQELLATGRCQLEISEALLDGDFPGHYFRRLKTVSMTMTGPIKTHANINCTLTLLDNRVRTSANASGSYAQAQDGDDSRFLINVVPVQAIATSRPNADPGVFQLRFDDNRYLPFEGAGAISSWRIDLHQSDNAIDLSELADVVVSLSYTAKSGGTPLEAVARANRETSLSRGGLVPSPQHRVSLRHDLPELWKQLQAANADQNVELKLPLSRTRLPGRFLEFDVRVEGLTIYAHSRNKLADDVLRLQIAPPAGGVVPVAGWNRPWPSSQTLRANLEAKGPPGPWTLTVSAKAAKVTDLLDDLILIFDLRAQRARS